MKKMILASLFASATVLAPAMANEVEEACEAYAAENGTDSSGCACLGEKAAGDADLVASIMSVTGPEDLEALDDAAKEVIGACFPDA